MAVLRMAKRQLSVDVVAIAASVPRPRQIAELLQVADDRGGCSFGDADRGGYVSHARGRIGRDALQHMGMVSHESPVMN